MVDFLRSQELVSFVHSLSHSLLCGVWCYTSAWIFNPWHTCAARVTERKGTNGFGEIIIRRNFAIGALLWHHLLTMIVYEDTVVILSALF